VISLEAGHGIEWQDMNLETYMIPAVGFYKFVLGSLEPKYLELGLGNSNLVPLLQPMAPSDQTSVLVNRESFVLSASCYIHLFNQGLSSIL
jgi:hypothetical protein